MHWIKKRSRNWEFWSFLISHMWRKSIIGISLLASINQCVVNDNEPRKLFCHDRVCHYCVTYKLLLDTFTAYEWSGRLQNLLKKRPPWHATYARMQGARAIETRGEILSCRINRPLTCNLNIDWLFRKYFFSIKWINSRESFRWILHIEKYINIFTIANYCFYNTCIFKTKRSVFITELEMTLNTFLIDQLFTNILKIFL